MKREALWAAFLIASLLGGQPVSADQPTQKDLDALRAVMEENFAACNSEDIKALIANHHPLIDKDKLAELRQEAEQCFEETDVRVRLVSFIVNYYEDPMAPGRVQMAQRANIWTTSAEAEIVQLTLPSDHSYADLEEYPAQFSTDFRHKSAMLPSSQLVKYTSRFAYDYKARKWKSLGIISKVEPVNQWPDNTREIMRGEPAFTTCRGGIASEPPTKRGGRK